MQVTGVRKFYYLAAIFKRNFHQCSNCDLEEVMQGGFKRGEIINLNCL